jgi:hypothetical protein
LRFAGIFSRFRTTRSTTWITLESHNYPGSSDGISGKRLLAALAAQADEYGVKDADTITSLTRTRRGFRSSYGDCVVDAGGWLPIQSIHARHAPIPALNRLIDKRFS